MNVKLENSDWRFLAEQLTKLTEAEGSRHFTDRLSTFLNKFVTVDSCAVFKVSVDKASGAEHICTFGFLDEKLSSMLAKDYISNGFKADPMVQTALRSKIIKVRHLPNSRYSSEYNKKFFEKAGLIDKVSSIHSGRNVIFIVSFYRAVESGRFSAQDFKDLKHLAPIIGRFVQRHAGLTGTNTSQDNYAEQIERLTGDKTQVFAKLSPKERKVCTAILMGDNEKTIAKSMGLAQNTIITYRRRIYSKLSIGSKAELFKLALQAQP